MGGKRITEAQENHYWALRAQSFSIARAAREAGFSVPAAKQREARKASGRDYRDAKGENPRGQIPEHPIPLDEVCQEAKDALADRTGNLFAKRYFGFELEPWQQIAFQSYEDAWDTDDREFLLENAPPGGGKSTAKVIWACKRIVLDRSIRILFMSRAHSLSERNAMRVRRQLERVSPPPTGLSTLSRDFGRFKPKQGGDVWKRDEFVVEQMDGSPIEEKEPTVSSFGFDSEWIGNRVEIVLGDDLDTTRSIRNLDIVEGRREVFDNELEPRLESGGLFVVTQQRLGAFDFSAHCLSKVLLPEDDGGDDEPEGVPQYHRVIFKAHYPEKCAHLSVAEQRAMHSSSAPAYPEGCLLSPKRLGWRDVRKAMNNPERFKVVYQQEDPGESGALVQKLWVDGGRDEHGQVFIGCWDPDRGLWQLPRTPEGGLALEGDVIGVISVDPSVTRYWSVQAWVYHPVSQQRFLLDLHRERMDAPEFLDWSHSEQKFVGIAEDWWHNFDRLGVPLGWVIAEANAAHRHMLQYEHFHRWMRARSVQVIGHSTQRNKADEELGVQMIGPRWRDGQVRLPGKGIARIQSLRLVDEVTRYPNAATTDCLMGQWFFEYNLDTIYTARPTNQPRLKRPGWLRGAA